MFLQSEKKPSVFFTKKINHIYACILIYCCPPSPLPETKQYNQPTARVGFMRDFISFFFLTTSDLRNKILTWIQDNQLTINSRFVLK